MVDLETKMRRLSLAKYLITLGTIASENNLPFSATSILNYHDAIEIVLDLILEDNSCRNNNLSFMGLVNKVNEILTDNKEEIISQTGSLDKLNKKRVALKHNGSFPSERDIQEARIATSGFFEEICEKYFDLDQKDINLIYLLNESNTKEFLLKVNTDDDMENIVTNLSLAFEYLIKDYEDTKVALRRKSPYKIFKHQQPRASQLKIKDKALKQYVETTNENLALLEEHVKTISFGFDFNKYAQFRLYVPKATLVSPGEFEAIPTGHENLNQNQIEFCKNFIIECALKLYSVDFEVPNDWGMRDV